MKVEVNQNVDWVLTSTDRGRSLTVDGYRYYKYGATRRNGCTWWFCRLYQSLG